MKVSAPRERVHQSYYDALIATSSYRDAARSILQPGRHQAFDLLVAPESIYVPVVEHEVCRYCWHDAPVDGRCDNCGARAGDRR